jgi:hypothetical protein
MADFELIELNSMLFGIIAFFILILILHKKIEFRRYVPGLICVIAIFIVEIFENGFYEDILDFIENIAILSGAMLLLRATLLEFYELKEKQI